MAYLALDAVSAAVYTLLNVASLTALATGGIADDTAQASAFPFVFYEVSERERRGLGTGGLPEVELRVHGYGRDVQGLQVLIQKVVLLLKDQPLTVAGYNQCGKVFYDETLTFHDELINGVKVHELVAMFRIFVEEAA